MSRLKLDTDKMIAEVDGGIGWVVFNNPDRRNAVGVEMQQALPVIFEAFRKDDSVRVVVMRGAGDKAFVSGADISQFEERRSSPEAVAEYERMGDRSTKAMLALEKPLIAMIRGFCMGGGLLTAMRADIRIAADDAQFGIPAARLGLGYGYGRIRPLVDLVGPANANEILFTGRRFKAEEALRIGLINRVVPVGDLESTVREMADMIAVNAPLTVKATKAIIREAVKDRADRDMALCERLVADCFASEDYAEGRHAFMEKRKPVFRGR